MGSASRSARDNRLDLVVTNYKDNNLSVFRGNGDGTFQPARMVDAGNLPAFVAAADLNGDHRPDLVVANAEVIIGQVTAGVSVLLNDGDGGFQPFVTYLTLFGAEGVAICDLDSDGRPDLAVADMNSDDVVVLLGNGDGTFKPTTLWPIGPSPLNPRGRLRRLQRRRPTRPGGRRLPSQSGERLVRRR
jgi:hypothetical protein